MMAECLHPAAAVLAEGPVWHAGQLWWVDIERGEVHRFDPATREDHSWELGRRVGFIVPASRGGFVVGGENGIARFDPHDGTLTPLADPEKGIEGNRFNDAKCDAEGRLWAGTMAVSEAPERGSLYRLDRDGRITQVVPKVSISNGLAWSPDRRTLYYVDSPTRRVDAFDYDAGTGAIRNRRTVIRIQGAFPDGMSADVEGRLWIALWGGWCVACYDPRTGTRLHQVDVPVEDVTSCCFGEGDDLYITTASRDVTEAERARQPLAGGLFRARVGVRGMPVGVFAGTLGA